MRLAVLRTCCGCFVLSWLLLVGRQVAAAEPAITTIAGTGQPADGGAEPAPGVKMNVGQPFGVELGPDGALYITEVLNHRIRRLDLTSGEITSIAGTGKKGYSGDGGAATQAALNEPYELRFDAAGNLYFVEMQNHLVRRIDAKTGLISTIAGDGQPGFAGDDGPAVKARFRNPHSIALDGKGGLYVADIGNHRIRRIDLKTGTITSIAGNGEKQLPRSGSPATGQPVIGPRALYFHAGTLWVALREGHSVWKLQLASGNWEHIAGSGKQGFSGDGGPATQATFNGPKGIAVGSQGDVFVVDTENQAIRRIDGKTGKISTVAGSGPKKIGAKGDGGPATQAEMNRPHGICVGPDGTLYIGDTENHRVRQVK